MASIPQILIIARRKGEHTTRVEAASLIESRRADSNRGPLDYELPRDDARSGCRDAALLDRILLRTSGRPRTRPFRERFRAYFLQPALTPRFAVGIGLALLFVALTVDLMMPRANLLASVLSPKGLFLQMDRGVQQIYSEGLKLYTAKTEWQTQFTFYKDKALKNLGLMIEQLDVPVEGKKKPIEQKQQEKNPGQNGQKSSLWLLPV